MRADFWLCGVLVGLIGGCALVLASISSRIGPIILPVYAAIIVAIRYFVIRGSGGSFVQRLGGSALALFVATGILIISVLIRGQRERATLVTATVAAPTASGGLAIVGLVLVAIALLLAIL